MRIENLVVPSKSAKKTQKRSQGAKKKNEKRMTKVSDPKHWSILSSSTKLSAGLYKPMKR